MLLVTRGLAERHLGMSLDAVDLKAVEECALALACLAAERPDEEAARLHALASAQFAGVAQSIGALPAQVSQA